jgi:hypothetical protein
MRTATGELNHDGTPIPPIAVAAVVNEFPANTKGIEITDEWSGGCSERYALFPIGNSRNSLE